MNTDYLRNKIRSLVNTQVGNKLRLGINDRIKSVVGGKVQMDTDNIYWPIHNSVKVQVREMIGRKIDSLNRPHNDVV